jgi:hypothetical protein
MLMKAWTGFCEPKTDGTVIPLITAAVRLQSLFASVCNSVCIQNVPFVNHFLILLYPDMQAALAVCMDQMTNWSSCTKLGILTH